MNLEHYPCNVISVGITQQAFASLAHQNLPCAHAVMELCDNALAAARPGEKAVTQIELSPNGPDTITLLVSDWGTGMSPETLAAALQLGSVPVSSSRLNEHGFGIKNALTSLSGGNGQWLLASRTSETDPYTVVQGPFGTSMKLYTVPALTELVPRGAHLCRPDPRTVICVDVPLAYARTLQTRGGPCSDAVTLRSWLLEHLGVAYRGYLEIDRTTMEPSARILLTVGDSTIPVPPIPVPVSNPQTHRFEVELGGQPVPIEYRFGLLDTDQRDHLIALNSGLVKAKCYYQGNITTQGIDIRLGKRVIATAQLEQIWRSERGEPLARHNSYNAFVGELYIPELPRGVLPTLNNKTGIDANDPGWMNLLGKLSAWPPPKSVLELTEKALKNRWMEILKAACPEDQVSDECCVWPPAPASMWWRRRRASWICTS